MIFLIEEGFLMFFYRTLLKTSLSLNAIEESPVVKRSFSFFFFFETLELVHLVSGMFSFV